jgi:hypothetical protein
MPLLPPVTSATLPLSLLMFFSGPVFEQQGIDGRRLPADAILHSGRAI